ncbi:hypothetical protein Hanom_Chr15g01355331 [Helianthus anomalus]
MIRLDDLINKVLILLKLRSWLIDGTNSDSDLLILSLWLMQIRSKIKKAGTAKSEKNRASVVAINAEIRRTKAKLLEEVSKLQRLLMNYVKGLSPEEFAARNDLVQAHPDRIQAIPDRGAAAQKQTGGWAASAFRTNNIKFDSDGRFDDEYFQQSDSRASSGMRPGSVLRRQRRRTLEGNKVLSRVWFTIYLWCTR